jgi:hypothetical protein
MLKRRSRFARCARFTLRWALVAAVTALLAEAVVAAVDPYYLVGAPSWSGINEVRPYYEARVVAVKPYQVWQRQPQAVALGSSNAEVGLDPHHPAWGFPDAFNFALPASNSYVVMLAFLHAQAVGAPLRQAVVGLDFFAYNINFPQHSDLREDRFADSASASFARFIEEQHPGWRSKPELPAPVARTEEEPWDERLYLAVNADVAAAVARREYSSGRDHYERAGRAEHRGGTAVPGDWDEAGYLQANPGVAAAVASGRFLSGYHHYLVVGRTERRLPGTPPSDWNEASYLAANPGALIQVVQGTYGSGYLHYAAVGRRQGLPSGLPAAGPIETLRLRWPSTGRALFRLADWLGMAFSLAAMKDAASTVLRQGEPAMFDDSGLRVFRGQEERLRQIGGTGAVARHWLLDGRWAALLPESSRQFCFGNPRTGMTMFDPYRFMLRQAYVKGTDLRLYVSPLNAALRALIDGLGLGRRYDFWLKELVRINEEEAARAGQPALPLWDFGDVNTITAERIPAADDPTPMRWYWEPWHFRKETGDLILDRLLGGRERARNVTGDFGVPLTGDSIDEHIARSHAGLAGWVAANSALALEIQAAVRDRKARSRQAEAACW